MITKTGVIFLDERRGTLQPAGYRAFFWLRLLRVHCMVRSNPCKPGDLARSPQRNGSLLIQASPAARP